MSGLVDLFGHPVDPRRGRPGRPRHFPTPASRDLVRKMHGDGAGQSAIGAALGLTEKTLRLHYPNELDSSSQAWRRHETSKGERNAS